jgi:ATP synthase protein I
MADKQEDSLEVRLKNLEAKLASKVDAGNVDGEQQQANRKGNSLAVKLSSEFIAGILAGAILGYLFDEFLGTHPWGMIVFLLLGFCASILNVLRATGKVAEPKFGSGKGDKN